MIYIGSAVNFVRRWATHESDLNLNKHKNRYLQHAWNKYGADAFEFIAIEGVDKTKLIEREQYWISITKCCDPAIGYNFYKKAGSPIGTKHTEVSRANMSKAHMGYKHTEEQKRKIGVAHKGRKFSEESLKKMSIAQKNNKAIRKLHKWPCKDGIRCECDECKTKKREYGKLWARRKKAKMPVEQFEIIKKVLGL